MSKKNDKGRRRSALEGKRLNAFAMDPTDLTIIGLDTNNGPEHALYDERVNLPVDDNLTKNIMVHGVIQNVVVAKDGERVLVVDGRQRVRSAREANARLSAEGKQPIAVPCTIRRGDDKDLFGVLISANEHRRGDSPLTKAAKAQRLIDMGKPEDEVAVDFGVSPRTLADLLKLLELSAKVKAAVDGGRLTASAAMQLHGLERKEQDAKLDELVAAGGKITARTTRNAVGKTGGAAAPGRRRVAKLAERLGAPYSVLLGWTLGEVSEEDLELVLVAMHVVKDPTAPEPFSPEVA